MQAAGVPGDVPANLAALDAAAREAGSGGADLLVTPEMFVTGYNIGSRVRDLAGRHLADRVAAIAKRRGIGLVAGLPRAVGGEVRNSAVLIDSDGSVLAVHDKTHRFGDLDRALFAAGTEPGPVVDFHGIRVGMLICYDVEFPEAVRSLALRGAQLIVVPTAQMEPYVFVAEQLIRVRAWENQVYLAYANRVGAEGGLSYVGRSVVVSPAGADVARGTADAQELLLADVEPALVDHMQQLNPYLIDRRPDLYAEGEPFTRRPHRELRAGA